MESIGKRIAKVTELPEVLSISPPITEKTHMSFDISDFCNQKCIYCTGRYMGVHKQGCHVDSDLFYRVTQEAFDLGVRELGLSLAGDPFTNPKFYDYVSYLKKIGFRYVFFSTNGLLCNSKNLGKLASAGIDSIKFTISAVTEESYIAHHGTPGFEKVYENLKYAYIYRKTHNYNYRLYVFSVITKQNMAHTAQMRKLFEPYCDELILFGMFNQFNMLTGCDIIYDDKGYGDITFVKQTLPCPEVFNRIAINAKGQLSICCGASAGPVSVGAIVADLNKVSLRDAYYSEPFKLMREKHIKGNIQNTICNRCVKGIIEPMYSLHGELFEIKQIDISQEIINAFN